LGPGIVFEPFPNDYSITTPRNWGKYADMPDVEAGEKPPDWPTRDDCQLWREDWVRAFTSIDLGQ